MPNGLPAGQALARSGGGGGLQGRPGRPRPAEVRLFDFLVDAGEARASGRRAPHRPTLGLVAGADALVDPRGSREFFDRSRRASGPCTGTTSSTTRCSTSASPTAPRARATCRRGSARLCGETCPGGCARGRPRAPRAARPRRHADDLFAAARRRPGDVGLPALRPVRRRGALHEHLLAQAASEDPLFFAVVDRRRGARASRATCGSTPEHG